MRVPQSLEEYRALPTRSRNRASVFADWVFRSDHKPYDRSSPEEVEERLEFGRITHARINEFFQTRWAQNHLPEGSWELIHADDRGAKSRRTFDASRLRVDGMKMRCRPDAAIALPSYQTLIIIERKSTNLPDERIPARGWDNVRAQLWCYSWIDEFLRYKRVILVGQLWRNRAPKGLELLQNHSLFERGNAFQELRCGEFFRRYGGKIYHV